MPEIPENFDEAADSGLLQPRLVLPSFERVRVTITEGAWKGERGWITGPKNEVDANPITTDGGICLCWFDSEICRENVSTHPHEGQK